MLDKDKNGILGYEELIEGYTKIMGNKEFAKDRAMKIIK